MEKRGKTSGVIYFTTWIKEDKKNQTNARFFSGEIVNKKNLKRAPQISKEAPASTWSFFTGEQQERNHHRKRIKFLIIHF